MPETRYIETYEDGVLVSKMPYEVSDAQLAEEKKAQRLANILSELDKIQVKLEEHEVRLMRDVGGHSR